MTTKTKTKTKTEADAMTDEQVSADMERAARAGALILALSKNLTDCPTCTELALIMALASIMQYNGSEPKRMLPLLQNLIQQDTLMSIIFNGAIVTAFSVPADTTPIDPSKLQ